MSQPSNQLSTNCQPTHQQLQPQTHANSPHEFCHGVKVLDLHVIPFKNECPRGFVIGEPIAVLLHIGLTATGIKNVWEIPRQRQKTRNMTIGEDVTNQ